MSLLKNQSMGSDECDEFLAFLLHSSSNHCNAALLSVSLPCCLDKFPVTTAKL